MWERGVCVEEGRGDDETGANGGYETLPWTPGKAPELRDDLFDAVVAKRKMGFPRARARAPPAVEEGTGRINRTNSEPPRSKQTARNAGHARDDTLRARIT
jgi:hypothetical protein